MLASTFEFDTPATGMAITTSEGLKNRALPPA